MESFGSNRSVQQGEDWNLDITLSGSSVEYIPYIISNQRKNPFIVLTVGSTRFEKNLRYVKSWWNDVIGTLKIPTFYQTVPQYYGEVDSVGDLPSVMDETAETRLLYQYTLKDDDIDPDLGHKPYYYFYFEYNSEGGVIRRVDEYECRVIFNFNSTDTAEWDGQNYLYQITLVSGELLADVLMEIAISKGMPSDWPDNIEEQYYYVKANWPDALQPDIDVDSPLGRIESPEPILRPTKLEVFNNIRKLI